MATLKPANIRLMIDLSLSSLDKSDTPMQVIWSINEKWNAFYQSTKENRFKLFTQEERDTILFSLLALKNKFHQNSRIILELDKEATAILLQYYNTQIIDIHTICNEISSLKCFS